MNRSGGKQSRTVKGVFVIAAFAVAGILALNLSRAATLPSIAVEAESGVLSGNQTQVADPGVSGTAVKFGANPINTGGSLLQPLSLGFAPYAYVAYGDVSMADYSTGANTKNFFAAFVLGSGCTPLWDGESSVGLTSAQSTIIKNDITAIRAKGGDVAVSFGGASGTELAISCTNVAQLQAAYQKVIDTYGLKHINFDLEGSDESNAAAMSRRVQAVAALQQANAGLKVSLTIPAEPSGLGSADLNVVKAFRDGAVTVASVGIMAMDFGGSSGAESSRVISAAQATVTQLKQVYSGLTTAQAYKALNIIVMIGLNDEPNETFTIADAQAVHTFAVQNGVGTISMWSAHRDMSCSGGSATVSDSCSGITQTKYQFANLLSIPTL